MRALNDQAGAGVYQWRQAELAKLEASDNNSIDNLREYALTGIDHLSIGSLTKHVTAVDPSMRFE